MEKDKIMNIDLIHGDCLIDSDKIKDSSVDLILTDLPYGTVTNIANSDIVKHGMQNKTEWDNVIDTEEIMQIANRILRKNGKMILFAQQPFTTELINKAIPNLPYNYSCIWKKDHFANSLIAKKAPVNYYEDILIFTKEYDIGNLHPLREYAKNVIDFIGLKLKQINNKLGHRKAEHFFYLKSTQFELCTKDIYLELIREFRINNMDGFINYAELERINKNYLPTFNLWEGKKYKPNILEYKKDYDGYHPTQKPVLLLKDLIKTFSNENNLIVDLTMGSGSAAIACLNTNRNFIGIELEEKYFEIAKNRVEERRKEKENKQQTLF